jgi:uncharacterized damage-inducible protein DinB
MKQQFLLMSKYNQWMNKSLFLNLKNMDEKELYGDRGAFWGSAYKTMSHVFTCDLIWLNRFANVQSSYNLSKILSQFPSPTSNTTHYFDTLSALSENRAKLDCVIIDWVSSITDTEFSTNLVYQNSSGTEFSESFASVLLHFFNHQTNHRGQVTTLLSQNGDNSYCTDLLELIR